MKFQKFVKQCDKTYVTASANSSIKENEKRNKEDGSAPPNSSSEQLPSTSKLGKKSSQLKSALHMPSGKSDDVLRGKDKKGCLDGEHPREKEKSATCRTKDCNGLNNQPGGGTSITQLRESKKKQVNDTAISIASNNNSHVDNMRIKVAKSSKCKDGEVPPAKKCKKDTSAGSRTADGVQVTDFIRTGTINLFS